MTPSYYRHEGAKRTHVFSGTLVHDHGSMDLSSAVEVKSWMRKNGGELQEVDLNVDLGTSSFTTPPLDVSVAGNRYEFETEITWPNGFVETVPNTGPLTIDVVDAAEIDARWPEPHVWPSYESPATFLRRMAPAQTHEGRRAFLAAADQLEEGEYMW
jgi:hypothetical protein